MSELVVIVQVGQHFGILATCYLLVVSVSTRLLLYFVAPLLPYLVCYMVQITGLLHRNLLEHFMGPLLVLRHHVP